MASWWIEPLAIPFVPNYFRLSAGLQGVILRSLSGSSRQKEGRDGCTKATTTLDRLGVEPVVLAQIASFKELPLRLPYANKEPRRKQRGISEGRLTLTTKAAASGGELDPKRLKLIIIRKSSILSYFVILYQRGHFRDHRRTTLGVDGT